MTEKEVYEEMEKQIAEIGREYRNEIIEEVAAALEQFTFAFGVDTVASFTTFVRGLKE
jgi:hypothetical protein